MSATTSERSHGMLSVGWGLQSRLESSLEHHRTDWMLSHRTRQGLGVDAGGHFAFETLRHVWKTQEVWLHNVDFSQWVIK